MRQEVYILTVIYVSRHASVPKCVMTAVHYYAIAARIVQLQVNTRGSCVRR